MRLELTGVAHVLRNTAWHDRFAYCALPIFALRSRMSNLYFYLDDSGTRHLNRPSTPTIAAPDWFAFGGVLFNSIDKSFIEQEHARFLERWPMIGGPLHSNEIRRKSGTFAFLRDFNAKAVNEFYDDLEACLLRLPVLAFACVIDRAGYLERFKQTHGHSRLWKLCKSAFAIAIERAAKYAERQSTTLQIAVERATKTEDRCIQQYFDELLSAGAPFGAVNSAQYVPMTSARLQAVIRGPVMFKTKQSACMQIADLFLYPMCQERYRPAYGPLVAFRKAGKLIDCHLDPHEIASRGIKYYCFPENTKAPESEPLAA